MCPPIYLYPFQKSFWDKAKTNSRQFVWKHFFQKGFPQKTQKRISRLSSRSSAHALFLVSLSFCLQEIRGVNFRRPLNLILFISRSPFNFLYSYNVAYYYTFVNIFLLALIKFVILYNSSCVHLCKAILLFCLRISPLIKAQNILTKA